MLKCVGQSNIYVKVKLGPRHELSVKNQPELVFAVLELSASFWGMPTVNSCNKLKQNSLRDGIWKVYIHKDIINVLNETPKHILGERIGAHFTLLGLGAIVRAAAIANFPKEMR